MSKKLAQAKAEHDKYLRKMGVHPQQLAAKRKADKLAKQQAELPVYDRIEYLVGVSRSEHWRTLNE